MDDENIESNPSRRNLLRNFGKAVAATGIAATIGFGNEKVKGGDSEMKPRVVVPGLATDTGNKITEVTKNPVENETPALNWTRDEVLMGPDAGFANARNGESIKVWFDPEILAKVGTTSFDKWNELAKKMGRKNDLFTVTDAKEGSQVYMLKSPTDYTFVDIFDKHYEQYKTHPNGEFSWVNIQCATSGEFEINNEMLLHEIGHALGIVDFLTPSLYENPASLGNYISPQPGYLADKPMKSIMNYNEDYDNNGEFGPDDGALIALCGYNV